MKGVEQRRAWATALMHSLVFVGPPNHAARKWDGANPCLWGMPAEWSVRVDACGQSLTSAVPLRDTSRIYHEEDSNVTLTHQTHHAQPLALGTPESWLSPVPISPVSYVRLHSCVHNEM